MQELSSVRNFFGKDQLIWWIGQVTDPSKGKWKTATERQRTEDGQEIYSHRVRVRIIGYHDCEEDLPDEDLPLAHVLLPPNRSVTAGQGELSNYQGGEVVIGFFLDGDDAQQPVVFGTLFKQTYQKDTLKQNEYSSKRSTCFQPWTPPQPILGKHQIVEEKVKEGNRTHSSDTTKDQKTVASKQKSVSEDNELTLPSPCEDTEIGRIQKFMIDFIERLNGYQKILDVYVDPIMGKIVNINEDLKTTAGKIFDTMTNLIRRARAWLIQEIHQKLSKLLGTTTPKPLEPYTGKSVQTLTDLIFCLFEKIIKDLFKYIIDSLTNMIGKIIDVPQCVVENFLGDMLGQLFNVLDNTLGPILSQINNVLGGILGSVSSIISQALKYANLFLSILGCDELKCPTPTNWSARYGPAQGDIDNFNKILGNASLSSLVSPGLQEVDDMIPSNAGAGVPDCSSNVFRCGPPLVDFVGGGGESATGSAVINAIGNIIGVAIDNSGFGFTDPPLITFYDRCKNGYGGGGYAIIGPVSPVTDDTGTVVEDDDGNPLYVPDPNGTETGIVDVVILDPGDSYLPNTTETSIDENGNEIVKEVIPDSNTNSDGVNSYITEIGNVVVQDTGYGYSDDTTISIVDDTSGAQIEVIVSDGFIVGANVLNGGSGFTSLPDLQINSDTGAGARLLPVLRFIKLEEAKQFAATTQDAIVTVIDCVQR
jgi:hypothetical protein